MKVVKDSLVAKAQVLDLKNAKQSIGLVPTMGALHEGHVSLIKESIQDNDITIVSIFVNPLQFNNNDDFIKYPVSIEADLKALEELNVDYVFMPNKEEMYPADPRTEIAFGHLDEIMEGKHRPGHFSGVAIIVAKLFNILSPTRAYFGQKDLQQVKVIESLVQDLSIDVNIVVAQTIREPNGLAMSSRNRRLSERGRIKAGHIFKALTAAANLLVSGSSNDEARSEAVKVLATHEEIKTEYLEIVNLKDLSSAGALTDTNPLVLCFAGFVEGVRLIDNVIVGNRKG